MSLGKLLVLALMIGAVVMAYRWIGRVQALRAGRAPARAARETAPPMATEDMAKCQVCGVYRAVRGAAACDRADCPSRFPGLRR